MTPFARSAELYDRLYRDRDAAAEVRALLARVGPVRSILDLGCGTGRHARLLADAGIAVVGVDRSPEMVAVAREKGVDARVGDVRDVRLGRLFDAAFALFHVVSYLVDDAAFDAALETARAHLDPRGRFFFDAWELSAMERDPPSARVKVVDGVTREAVPTLRGGGVVEVRYRFASSRARFEELHVVRARTVAEIERALERARFRPLDVARVDGTFGVEVLAEAT